MIYSPYQYLKLRRKIGKKFCQLIQNFKWNKHIPRKTQLTITDREETETLNSSLFINIYLRLLNKINNNEKSSHT